METKKNRDKNAERLRMPIAFAGLLFTGGLVLASFTYHTPVEEQLLADAQTGENVVQYQQEVVEQQQQETPPEQPAYVPPPQAVITPAPPTTTPPTPTPPITPPTPPVITQPVGTGVSAEIIEIPQVDAMFPGGAVEMQKWIASNVVYPEISISMEEQGRVYVTFVVERDGSISGIEVVKGVSKDLDREAKRLVRSMPKWTPGENEGKKVRSRCNLPIVFTLK